MQESSLKVLVGFVCMEVSKRHGCTLLRLACSDDQAIESALWHLRVATAAKSLAHRQGAL